MRTRATAIVAALTFTAAAGAPALAATTTPKPKTVTKLTVGAVPSLDLGLIQVARNRGFLKAAGLDVAIVPVDSGPNVVTGVVAGQYDIGSTAYAPPLLALANGAPVRYLSNVGTVGRTGTNGGTLVRKDSGITTWKDLAGKRIASNAPRSLFSLTVPAAIAAAGGDASRIQIVPLPFSEIPKAVSEGKVDAGVALEPFLTKGLAEYTNLTNIGDSIAAVLPKGSGSGVYFTSDATAASKAKALRAFATVIRRTIVFANAHPDAVKLAGASQAGLTKPQALAIATNRYTADIEPLDLGSLINLMIKFRWFTNAPDLLKFLKDV